MSSVLVVPSGASFPQTTNNRLVSEIIDDLLDYTGGGDRAEARNRARRALAETLRLFNAMAWRFCRKTKDITFVADTSDYDLDATTRDIWKVSLLDSSDRLVGDIAWVPYPDFLRYDGSTESSVTVPDEYTTFNLFDTGQIRFLPRLGTTFTYPKARVFYHKRIVAVSDDSRLEVPPEVETAIVRQAAALLIGRVRTFEEAIRARQDADAATQAIMREWRDFPDFVQKMGN